MTDPTDTPTDTPEGGFALPENYADNTAFEGIDSVDTLAERYAETHQQFTELKDGQPVLPESADKYELTVADGLEANPEIMEPFKQWAFDAGLSQEKAQMMSDNFNELMGGIQQRMEQDEINAENAKIDELKKEWGSDFEARAEAANKGLNRFFNEAKIGPEDQKEFTKAFGNNTVAIKIFHAIGQKVAESPTFSGDGGPPADGPGRTEGGTPMLHDYSKTMT